MSRFLLAASVVCVGAASLICGCGSNGSSRAGGEAPSVRDGARLGDAIEMIKAAEEAEDNGRIDEAISNYRQALDAYAEFPAAWNNLGVLLMQQERYLEAGECFNTSAELAPTDPRPIYNLGLTWDRAGYLDQALEHYLQAVRRDGRYLPALRGSIRAERLLGVETESTLERVQKALLMEQDERWRDWLSFLKLRIEATLEERALGRVG